MVAETTAKTTGDLIEILWETERVAIYSMGTHALFRRPPDPVATRVRVALSGIVRNDVSDQIVVLNGNTPLAELQSELAKHGQCIPYLPFYASMAADLASVKGTVAGHLSMNLPHAYQSMEGSWKEWLLGAKVVLANGLMAKCGSQVVKNVAGYDLHRFLIGARGTMAVVTEVTLRTYPLKALGAPDLSMGNAPMRESGVIQRTLNSDFDRWEEMAGHDLIATHPAASTLYRNCDSAQIPSKPNEGWFVGWGLGDQNVSLADPVAEQYFARAKQQFDPNLKLNSTEFGRV